MIRPVGLTQPVTVRRAATPVVALLVGMPVWWALGMQVPAWVIVAVPLGLWLLVNRRSVELPMPFLYFAAFLGWVAVSALALTSARYGASYLLRATLYAAAFIIGLFVWNIVRRGLNPQVLIRSVVAFWAAAVLLATLGLLLPDASWTSPVEWILNSVGIQQDFLIAMTHPTLSQFDPLYEVARPSALFAYTNDWGAAMGVLTPVAVYACLTDEHRGLRRGIGALLVLSVVPIVVSVNRGCWVSIAVAVAYVVARRTMAGDLRALVYTGLAFVGGLIAVVASPLAGIIEHRFAFSNTSTRANLYDAALVLAGRSPVIGYGAPQSSAGLADSNSVSVGTHGQLWTVLVSQGFVGLALFLVMLVSLWWTCRPISGGAPEIWLHAVCLVVIVQIAFYEIVPGPLSIAFIAGTVCAVRAGRFRPQPLGATSPDLPTSRKEAIHGLTHT